MAEALFNESFFDPYDLSRFSTGPTTTLGDQMVEVQGEGGSIEWGHVVGYSVLGAALAALSILLIKKHPELADGAWRFFLQVVGRIRVLLARGDGQPAEGQYESPAPPLSSLDRPLPPSRIDLELRDVKIERPRARSTAV